jgi:hypothetical protein
MNLNVMFIVVMAGVLPVLAMTGFPKRKTKWHGDHLQCDGCGQAPPLIRMPKTIHEGLWGGWTCQDCGTRNEVGLHGEAN